MSNPIQIQAQITAPQNKVWEAYTSTEAITKWNTPSPDWHSPRAESDLRPGGHFKTRMEAKDGSMGFDFEGDFVEVEAPHHLSYMLGDKRKADIRFEAVENGAETLVTIVFDPEDQNPEEFQKQGWQAILDNFKAFVENQ